MKRPATKTKDKEELPPTQISRLLNKYAISLQDLKDCMEPEVKFASRSTLHRMVRGELSDELSAELRPVAARCLKRFLHARGLNKPEIDAELTTIFNEGEYQPMSIQKICLSRAELNYFGLRDDPFSRKTDPQSRDEVYFPPEYREVFDQIIDAAKYRHFIAVLGPVGSSKSTLQDLIRDQMTREASLRIVWPEFYNQGNLTPSEIARAILRALGVEKIPQRATALAEEVTKHLRALTEEGNRTAIIIDNVHEMNKAAVRSLKKFLEMSSGGFQRYLGVILMGWPSFEQMLQEADFTEIYERLDVVPMPPFTKKIVNGHLEYVRDQNVATPLMQGYIEKRFDNIGADAHKYFDQDALTYIAENAETPLQCGNIANKALRISMTEYDEKKVAGAALRLHMFFDAKPVSSGGFRKR